MITFKEVAQAYEPKKTLNIADLDSFDISEPLEERKGKDSDGKEFEYFALIRDNLEYRVPNGVVSSIKGIIAANEKHGKEVSTFTVEKTGEGINSKYQVITL